MASKEFEKLKIRTELLSAKSNLLVVSFSTVFKQHGSPQDKKEMVEALIDISSALESLNHSS